MKAFLIPVHIRTKSKNHGFPTSEIWTDVQRHTWITKLHFTCGRFSLWLLPEQFILRGTTRIFFILFKFSLYPLPVEIFTLPMWQRLFFQFLHDFLTQLLIFQLRWGGNKLVDEVFFLAARYVRKDKRGGKNHHYEDWSGKDGRHEKELHQSVSAEQTHLSFSRFPPRLLMSQTSALSKAKRLIRRIDRSLLMLKLLGHVSLGHLPCFLATGWLIACTLPIKQKHWFSYFLRDRRVNEFASSSETNATCTCKSFLLENTAVSEAAAYTGSKSVTAVSHVTIIFKYYLWNIPWSIMWDNWISFLNYERIHMPTFLCHWTLF